MKRKTTGRKYRCDNKECRRYTFTWVSPLDKFTGHCVCDETPTFLGYVEEQVEEEADK
jgi:hypothetical protein